MNKITVIQSLDNTAIGKKYTIGDSGNLEKISNANCNLYLAVVLEVNTIDELKEIIKNLTAIQAIILGYPEVSTGTPFSLISEKELKNKLNKQPNDPRPLGIHTIDQEIYLGRFTENFKPSSWILIDRDTPEDLPEILRAPTINDYINQCETVIPGFKDCQKLIVPSSSNRVAKTDQPDQLTDLTSCHIYLKVQDPADIIRFRKELYIKLFANQLGYAKLNDLGVGMKRTIIDLSVLSPERIIFESAPLLVGKRAQAQYTILSPEFTHQGQDCKLTDAGETIEAEPLDTSAMTLSTEEKDTAQSLYQIMSASNNNRAVDVEVPELTMSTSIVTKLHGEMTVAEYKASQYAGEKLRCQTTPFRESSSWNGILNTNHHNDPCLFDNGTKTLYTLANQQNNPALVKANLQKIAQATTTKQTKQKTELTQSLVKNNLQKIAQQQKVKATLPSENLKNNWITGDADIPWEAILEKGTNTIEGIKKVCPIDDGESLNAIVDNIKYGLPDLILSDKGDIASYQACSIRQIRYVMNKMCISVRYNILTKTTDYKSPIITNNEGTDTEHLISNINYHDRAFEDVCFKLKLKHKEKIMTAVDQVALENSYHPFKKWVDSDKWDGVNRLPQLYKTINLLDSFTDPLKEIYLKKFMLQIITGVYAPKPIGLRMCLTFTGGQALGKTQWFKWLVGDRRAESENIFLSGYSIANHNKTSEMMENNSKFVLVELGELDATFRRSDVSALKAFISRDEESYRAAYARRTITTPRRVIYCATVNDVEFLADQTGNTRFPVLHVNSFEHELMNEMEQKGELQQTWAQIKTIYDNNPMSFELSKEEQLLQAEDEVKYTMRSHAEEVLEDYFESIADRSKALWGGVTIMDLLKRIPELTKFDKKDMKRYMLNHFGESTGVTKRFIINKETKQHINLHRKNAYYAPLGDLPNPCAKITKLDPGGHKIIKHSPDFIRNEKIRMQQIDEMNRKKERVTKAKIAADYAKKERQLAKEKRTQI